MEITRLNRQVKALKVEVNRLGERSPTPDLADDESKDIKVAKDKFGLSLVEAQQLINEQRIKKEELTNELNLTKQR